MLKCRLSEFCGGCEYRHLSAESYNKLKEDNFRKILSGIKSSSYKINSSIFIKDGTRRRATFAFEYKKKKLVLGFNQKSSHSIVDIKECCLLTPRLNNALSFIRDLILAICCEPYKIKKGKKIIYQNISFGDIFVCDADNGVDVVLEYDAPLELSHRMIIFEMSQKNNNIIRISHRKNALSQPETVIEKTRPVITLGSYQVMIPAGTFLQPSVSGQKALGDLVMKYLSETKGNIADLFCGVGTFSYLMASCSGINITAIDSSRALLEGFQESLNGNQISNIKIVNKNLFKYPLIEDEIKEFTAIVFDPPRAGAKAVCKEIAKSSIKPEIIVAVSCNPQTFVNDANILIEGGYDLTEITMVDQFIYSNHSELVARFTKRQI